MKDLYHAARKRADAGLHDHDETGNEEGPMACDSCHGGSRQSPGYALFCSEEDDVGNVTFQRADYSDESCQSEHPTKGHLEQMTIGVEAGSFYLPQCSVREGELKCFLPYQPLTKPQADPDAGCSAQQPPDYCDDSGVGPHYCACDDNCNPTYGSVQECCTLRKTVEHLSLYYRWWDLSGWASLDVVV